jgi:NADH-quinone oxidoreductase subunit H
VATLVVVGAIAVLVLAAAWWWDSRQLARSRAKPQRPEQVDPFAGGYPVPPLPGQVLREPERPAPAVGAARPKEDVRG